MPPLAELITTHLPEARQALLTRISQTARQLHLPLYLVGGFVRDALLGLPPDDFDLVVEGPAPQLVRALAQAYGGETLVHPPFGTATWLTPPGEAIDFASARTETYARPAALPTVSTPASIEADLRRRDFTINTLTVRLDGEHFGELLDPLGGQADLTGGAIRALHSHSFVDDPTRLFRAVRYEQRLNFHLAPETLALIPGAWDSLAALTPDRVRHEFELIFREPRANAMLERLQNLDILRHIHPALRWEGDATERAEIIRTLPIAEWRLPTPPEPDALYLALLLAHAAPSESAEALARLNVNRAAAEAVQSALALPALGSRPSEAVAVLDNLSELAVITAYVLSGHPALSNYLSHWRLVRPTLTGDDLIARGLQPGPHFKTLLWQLRAARLDGDVTTDAEEFDLLEELAR